MPQFVPSRHRPKLWLSGATALLLGLPLFAGPLMGKLADAIGRPDNDSGNLADQPR